MFNLKNSAILSAIDELEGKFYIESRLGAYDPRFQKALIEMSGPEKVGAAHCLIKKEPHQEYFCIPYSSLLSYFQCPGQGKYVHN